MKNLFLLFLLTTTAQLDAQKSGLKDFDFGVLANISPFNNAFDNSFDGYYNAFAEFRKAQYSAGLGVFARKGFLKRFNANLGVRANYTDHSRMVGFDSRAIRAGETSDDFFREIQSIVFRFPVGIDYELFKLAKFDLYFGLRFSPVYFSIVNQNHIYLTSSERGEGHDPIFFTTADPYFYPNESHWNIDVEYFVGLNSNKWLIELFVDRSSSFGKRGLPGVMLKYKLFEK